MKKEARHTEARIVLGQGEHIRVRPIYCGKAGRCKSCPHAFYAYKVFRVGKRVREVYLWPCDSKGRESRKNQKRK